MIKAVLDIPDLWIINFSETSFDRFNKFGSIRSAKLCDRSEMEDLIGLDKSKKVYDYWNLWFVKNYI